MLNRATATNTLDRELRIASLEVYMPLGQKDLAAKIAAEPLAPTWVWEKVPGVSHGKGIRMCNSAGGN